MKKVTLTEEHIENLVRKVLEEQALDFSKAGATIAAAQNRKSQTQSPEVEKLKKRADSYNNLPDCNVDKKNRMDIIGGTIQEVPNEIKPYIMCWCGGTNQRCKTCSRGTPKVSVVVSKSGKPFCKLG